MGGPTSRGGKGSTCKKMRNGLQSRKRMSLAVLPVQGKRKRYGGEIKKIERSDGAGHRMLSNDNFDGELIPAKEIPAISPVRPAVRIY